MITPGKWSYFHSRLCPTQDMLHQYTVHYIHKGWNTLANTDFHKLCSQHKTQQNSTQFKHPLCHLIFLSQLQAASPTPQRTHLTHFVADGRTDTVYCTSQTMLINHEYGLPSNGTRHRAYWMSSKWHKAQDILNVIKMASGTGHTKCHQNGIRHRAY